MKKTILILLCISVVLLNVIYLISAHSFMGLYYVLWIGGVGAFIWKKRETIGDKLKAWSLSEKYKFLLLGCGAVLLEEMLASFSIHLSPALTLGSYLHFVTQFWATNIFALAGFIIGWYLLLSRFEYSRKEVFILAGIFGLYAEKIFLYLLVSPLPGILLILPTVFTYGIIIFPAFLSLKRENKKILPKYMSYPLGVFVPFIVSIPFVIIVVHLMKLYPTYFYFAG